MKLCILILYLSFLKSFSPSDKCLLFFFKYLFVVVDFVTFNSISLCCLFIFTISVLNYFGFNLHETTLVNYFYAFSIYFDRHL